jgi:hypothetical protein
MTESLVRRAHGSADRPELSAAERSRLEAVTVGDPDELLQESSVGRLTGAFSASLLVHVLVLALTSVPLFIAWSQYGLALPADIRAMKKKENEEAQKIARDAELAKQREEAAAKQQQAEENQGDRKSAAPKTADKGKAPIDQKREKPASSFNIEDLDLDL